MTLKKYILILSAIFAFTFVSFAEEKEMIECSQENELIFVSTAGKTPYFPGGTQALMRFLNENMKMPNNNEGIQGRVVAQFTIDTTGKISNIEIVRSLSPAFDREVIRVIELMPDWIPGKQQKEDVRYFLPFNFPLPKELK